MTVLPSNLTALRIHSNDVKKSSSWYEELFSIAPTEKLENFVAYRLGSFRLEICLADTKSPSSHGGWCPYFEVTDLDQTLKNASSLGGKLYRGPLYVEETKSTIAQILDPSGNVLGVECSSKK